MRIPPHPLILFGFTILSACVAPLSTMPTKIPAPVAAPAGHMAERQLVGRGMITYACKISAGMAGWTLVGTEATLHNHQGTKVGRHYGPPATFRAEDGSIVTGKEIAASPLVTGSDNLPAQLWEANPATGLGMMRGVTYVQRLNVQGGVAPQRRCDPAEEKQVVNYQATYIFYRAQSASGVR